MEHVGLVVPTLNGGALWLRWLKAFSEQVERPAEVLVIDSSSDDGTPEAAEAMGLKVVRIPRASFQHGATRQLAAELVSEDVEILIYLTQDAILHSTDSLKRITNCFSNPSVGAAYGRQLPRLDAGPIEAHARLFNYPQHSYVKSSSDARRLGIKTVFFSNSFAAYRRSALRSVGGFPSDTIVSEDTYVVAKMVMSGWTVAYCADATVHHSHRYTLIKEFQRYFDVGVFYGREKWIREFCGKAEGEGSKYVFSEVKFLGRHNPVLIPSAILRNGIRFLGYKIGNCEHLLPRKLKHLLTMQKGYWPRNY